MALLNITYRGQSVDYALSLDSLPGDDDIRRIAIELVREGSTGGLHAPDLADDAFAGFVVDRLRSPTGEDRIYLRPKVPFGR